MGFTSRHITPLVIYSQRGRRAHAQLCIPTICTESFLRNQVGAPGLKIYLCSPNILWVEYVSRLHEQDILYEKLIVNIFYSKFQLSAYT